MSGIKKKTRLPRFCAVLLAAFSMLALSLPASAAAETTAAVSTAAVSSDGIIRDTLDISRPKKDIVGGGYVWKNIDETLKLSGFELHTDSDYGIRIAKGATIELSGKNYISAKKAAIACQGSVTFTGSGSLTLVSEDGIMSYSSESGTVITIRSGNIAIEAQSCGIRCESGDITLSGGDVDITSDGQSLLARTIALADCSLNADSPVHATDTLRITAAEVDVSVPSGAALVADGNLITEKIDMISDGQPVDSYDGKSRISTVSNAYRGGTSAILGEGYPRIADVIIAAAAVLLLAALIAVPLIRHNAKTKALKRRLAEAEQK